MSFGRGFAYSASSCSSLDEEAKAPDGRGWSRESALVGLAPAAWV